MANSGSKGFLLTTNFYKSANYSALLDPKKRKLEEKAAVHLEETTIKNKENTKTKQPAKQEIYAQRASHESQ